MSDQEIFDYLFSMSGRVLVDGRGTVVSALVRDGEVIAEGASPEDAVHSEYWLLKEMARLGIVAQPGDVVYTTVEPCGKRTPGGAGERMGDCTTNLIAAGLPRVVFAAADHDASGDTRHKFGDAGGYIRQVEDPLIRRRALELFNGSLDDGHDALYLG